MLYILKLNQGKLIDNNFINNFKKELNISTDKLIKIKKLNVNSTKPSLFTIFGHKSLSKTKSNSLCKTDKNRKLNTSTSKNKSISKNKTFIDYNLLTKNLLNNNINKTRNKINLITNNNPFYIKNLIKKNLLCNFNQNSINHMNINSEFIYNDNFNCSKINNKNNSIETNTNNNINYSNTDTNLNNNKQIGCLRIKNNVVNSILKENNNNNSILSSLKSKKFQIPNTKATSFYKHDNINNRINSNNPYLNNLLKKNFDKLNNLRYILPSSITVKKNKDKNNKISQIKYPDPNNYDKVNEPIKIINKSFKSVKNIKNNNINNISFNNCSIFSNNNTFCNDKIINNCNEFTYNNDKANYSNEKSTDKPFAKNIYNSSTTKIIDQNSIKESKEDIVKSNKGSIKIYNHYKNSDNKISNYNNEIIEKLKTCLGEEMNGLFNFSYDAYYNNTTNRNADN